MIVKVPVYLNLDEKFHPDEVGELTEEIRIRLTKTLRTTMDHFTIEYFGRNIRLDIMTSAEVKAVMTGSTLGRLRQVAKNKVTQRTKK